MAENESNEELRENFFVKLAKRIKSEISKAVSGKLDKSAVVKPASNEELGKAADAKLTGEALDDKVAASTLNSAAIDYTNNEHSPMLRSSDDCGIVFEDVHNGVTPVSQSILYPDGTDVATLAKLSGITAQDIADFLKYKGERTYIGSLIAPDGDVYFAQGIFSALPENPGFYRSKKLSSGSFTWEFIYAKDEGKTGIEKLLSLFGSDNEYLKETIDKNAVIYLKYENGVIKNGDVTLTKFSDLAAIVKTGRAVLQATATSASGSSPVLFRPHMINDGTGAQAANILFDATGTIDEGIYTRCIRAAIKAGTTDDLLVQGDKQRERLAKYSDISAANATFKAAVTACFDNADTTEY